MRRRRRVVLGAALAAVVAAGGCQESDSPLATTARAIVAGTLDGADPAIMELVAQKSTLAARCTATLITPRVLLTAAHCFTETVGFRYAVFPRNDDTNFTDKDLLPLQATVYDPSYNNMPRQGNDFAIIVLATPLDVPPVRLNRVPIDGLEGKAVRYVGYGLSIGSDRSSGGIKRQATAPIAQINGTLIAIAPNAHGSCPGDSGGPMLINDGRGESIVGIASFVDNPSCLRDSFFQRVDTQLAWVDQQIKKYDPGGLPPVPDGGADSDASAPADPTDATDATDARAPLPTADAQATVSDGPPAPAPEPPRDARAPDVGRPEPDAETAPAPGETTTNLTGGSSSGCSYAGGTRAPAGPVVAGMALLLARAVRRRRKR